MLSHHDIMDFHERVSDRPRSPRSPKKRKVPNIELKEEMIPCYNFFLVYCISKVPMTKIRKLLKKYVPHENFLCVSKDDEEDVKFSDDENYLKEKGSKKILVYLSTCQPISCEEVSDVFQKENIMVIKNFSERIRPIEKKLLFK